MIALLALLLLSCDFTPPLNKEVLKAQNYISQRDYLKATIKYTNILRRNPPVDLQVKINYQLGDLYSIYLGEYKKALSSYEEVLKISKDPLWQVKAQEKLGDVYFSFQKDFYRSSQIYSQLSSFEPRLSNYDLYLFRYALSEYKLGKLVSADTAFKKIFTNKTGAYKTRSLFYRALCSFEKKEWQKTISFLEQYIREEKRKDYVIEAKFLMANAYESMESLKNAYNIYYSILGDYPNTKVIQNRLKGIYSRRVARKR